MHYTICFPSLTSRIFSDNNFSQTDLLVGQFAVTVTLQLSSNGTMIIIATISSSFSFDCCLLLLIFVVVRFSEPKFMSTDATTRKHFTRETMPCRVAFTKQTN